MYSVKNIYLKIFRSIYTMIMVILEKIHTRPTEEISTTQGGGGGEEQCLKCPKCEYVQFPLWEGYGSFMEQPISLKW